MYDSKKGLSVKIRIKISQKNCLDNLSNLPDKKYQFYKIRQFQTLPGYK
ncbi:MAG: hypothetical protein P857_695 [Candidatus Xenolissoclinum pacificiensis L6]|uniref:Uncharacterized protein n=1 Tax=Candidatus Xenolissoclinum pacificiensis L6 TaxID=1401685 RepID=W2UZE0_9RICK|nr:MAG: hypothetical protein P857_695 [Candidatus Xenolissoclinum pacificiensis L6]